MFSDQVKHSLLQLLKNTSAIEQKWLIRMIMKEMRLGISEQSILNAFHVDAKDLYDVSNSLSKVVDQEFNLNVFFIILLLTPFAR